MVTTGLVVVTSKHTFDELLARVSDAVKARGMTVFAQFDHAANAAAVGMELPPLTVVVFGDPRVGTNLMVAEPAIGIELPLKLLVWTDRAGVTSLAYTDPQWLAARYGIADSPIAAKMTAMIAALAKEVA